MDPSYALLSVSDKTGIVELAGAIIEAGHRILSTGGTARALSAAGVPVQEVSAYTDFPEIMDGRVKTLHPRIHGGLLARRDDPAHRVAMAEHGIAAIDLVVVNLYPFVATIQREGVTREAAIEEIDIGGPSMLRAAAKNHEHVCVVCDPTDYAEVAAALRGSGVSKELRARLAAKVFAHTAAYDAAIADYLAGTAVADFGEVFQLRGERIRELRYGENPHQRAAFYRLPAAAPATVAGAEFLGGNKELSYNNILDLDAALALVREFSAGSPACAIIKHNNPCGAAQGATLAAAFDAALESDPVSAFGSIVACNVEVDRHAAQRMAVPGNFLEALIAPAVSEEALAILRGAKFGKNLRVLATGALAERPPVLCVRSVAGGFLVQDEDSPGRSLELAYVTARRPSHEELQDLRFAWCVAKHVRSNAIVLARGQRTVGVGAGQMSRVDSVGIAVEKAGARAAGAVLASDAFFPFEDGLIRAAEAGVTAVIQPGGSRRDKEVIAAADEREVAMVFTGVRHFKH